MDFRIFCNPDLSFPTAIKVENKATSMPDLRLAKQQKHARDGSAQIITPRFDVQTTLSTLSCLGYVKDSIPASTPITQNYESSSPPYSIAHSTGTLTPDEEYLDISHESLSRDPQGVLPLLPVRLAGLVSSLSMGARVSLRVTGLIIESVFDSLKLGAATSLGVGRRTLVSAVSTARALHLLTNPDTDAEKESPNSKFYRVLDQYTNNSIYAIHATFSLAELLTITTFHLYSSTIRFTLEMADEVVHIFDGLFGSTDTSKALAAIIALFMQEWQGQDDALGLTQRFGKVYALGQITKTFIAYICLQYLNRTRWRSLVQLSHIYSGRVPRIKGRYDPSAVVKTIDMFNAPGSKTEGGVHIPEILRRASMEVLGRRDARLATSKSFEHLSPLGKHDIDHSNEIFTHLYRSKSTILNLNPYISAKGSNRRRCVSESKQQIFGESSNSSSKHEACKPVIYSPLPLFSLKPTPVFTSCELSDSDTESGNSPEPTHKKIHTQTSFLSMKSPNLCHSPTATDARTKIKNGARYVQFAVGAYGTHFLKLLGIEKPRATRFNIRDEHHNHYSLANHTDIPVHHILTSSYNDELVGFHAPRLSAPVHYVVVDTHRKVVLVSLRGTLGLSDIVTDLAAKYEWVEKGSTGGYVHSGIWGSACLISDAIKEEVARALESNPSYSLVLTGHSLGGGCASLLAMIWSEKIVNPDTNAIEFVTDATLGLPRRPIECYVFGCPAVMSAELSKSFQELVSTFIYRHDVVPCLSLGMVRDFRNITISFSKEEGMAESVIAKVLGVFKGEAVQEEKEKERDDLWYWALLKTLRADMKAEKLYPPGTIYWINGQDSGFAAETAEQPKQDDSEQIADKETETETTPISIWKVDDVENAFGEIVFSTSMFSDHSPHHYENTLQLLSQLV